MAIVHVTCVSWDAHRNNPVLLKVCRLCSLKKNKENNFENLESVLARSFVNIGNHCESIVYPVNSGS